MSRRASLASPMDGMNQVPSKLRNLVGPSKPEIKILLNSQRKVFSTMDKIDGSVEIIPSVDTTFSDIEIEFVGTSRTYVERLTTAAAVSGRAEAFHQFLKLQQPGLEHYYPLSGTLLAGQTYTLPFVFVVPQQLLPRICQHKVQNDHVREAHTRLPPSFGDKDLLNGANALDDMAPEMASVRYGIFAKINRMKFGSDETPSKVMLASKARNVRIIPAAAELPPMDISASDPEYCLRKERTVRKGVLKGKSGAIVLEASQPPSLQFNVGSDDEPATTMATINLRFDPFEEGSKPPRLGSLASKLKVVTFFASSARQTFPSRSGALLDLSQGSHSEQVQLSQRCVAIVEWTKVDIAKRAALPRRDSACSMADRTDEVSPSTHYKGGSYYTARILAPVTLPSNKSFVPTFHSCLITRCYFLKLDLSVPSASGVGTSIELKVPIQISSRNDNGSASPLRRASVASATARETHGGAEYETDFFEPRLMRAPRAEFVGNSRIGSPIVGQSPTASPLPSTPEMEDLPPGYSPFGMPATQPRTTIDTPAFHF